MFHTDQGVLYLMESIQKVLAAMGYTQSMSKRGNCQDNAPMESFFSRLKAEVPLTGKETLEELAWLIEQYADYYNTERPQTGRDKMTPDEYDAHLRAFSPQEREAYLARKEKEYKEMKERAKELAIERARTLGTTE